MAAVATGRPTRPDYDSPRFVGATVRHWREDRGWTQEYAARWWGVSVRQWRRYETGETPAPRPLVNRLAGTRDYGRAVAAAMRDMTHPPPHP